VFGGGLVGLAAWRLKKKAYERCGATCL
jgi:hypothetical protein